MRSHLAGGGTLGAMMRAHDWASTPLGPPESWPRSLKTAVRIVLTARQPFWIGWGPELLYLYNDQCRDILGARHSDALGRPLFEVWPELRDIVGPMAETAMKEDAGTYLETQFLLAERGGYQEETYHTFSCSPIPGADFRPGGIICANTDETRRIVASRELATLRDVAAGASQGTTWREACAAAVDALVANRLDVPFALLYVARGQSPRHRLEVAGPGTEALQAPVLWPLSRALSTNEIQTVSLAGVPGPIPSGAWPSPPSEAAVVPLGGLGRTDRSAVLVAGLNPHRAFDRGYRGFFDLVAKQIASGVANADAYARERERADALAEVDKAKTVFMSNVSHELRTPLTLMLGPLAEVLETSGALGEEERESLEMTYRNARRLLKLVNSLLDFSRIEAGRIDASYEATDVASLTAELASLFRSTVERAGLRFVVDCPALDTPVYVDREMWEKIVFNLLSNAYKFTFAGEIVVSVEAGDEQVTLSVRDTGVGIPKHELSRLFERFHRVRGVQGRSFEGSGIGLSLVWELAKLHGGYADVTSEVGEGTTFTVSVPTGAAHLPPGRVGITRAVDPTAVPGEAYLEEMTRWAYGLEEGRPAGRSDAAVGAVGPRRTETPSVAHARASQRSDAPGAEAERAPSSPTSVEEDGGARILLVDDSADMRDYLTRLLAPLYEVEAVADGVAALQAARDQPPDLIISDVMMPHLGGFELLREIRSDERLQPTPFIILSGRPGEVSRAEGIYAGADDYLIKPFSARELLAHVAARIETSRLRKERGQLVGRLLEADRRKDEFLAMLGHELRNPLAAVASATRLLRMAHDDARIIGRAVEVLERQTARMATLIDGLLDVSRVERGKIVLDTEILDLREVVSGVADDRKEAIPDGIEVRLSLVEEPVWVSGDRVRLVQVVDNLLYNAINFTSPPGTIELSVEVERETALLVVRDTGAGISDSMLTKIFEPFRQGPQGIARAEGGLGLGLALSKGIVDLHLGTIEAVSEGIGRGAEFRVTIPLTEPPPAEGETTAADAAARARRILLVEDNEDAADAMRELLELSGHDVRVARDGASALNALRDRGADIVLCDIGLPGMNGYELARAIRSDGALAGLPLVAITGYGQPEERRASAEAGFDQHLTKPVRFDDLEEVLRTLAGFTASGAGSVEAQAPRSRTETIGA